VNITTEHRGYLIRFSENEDKWRSYDLDLEDTSLAKLKDMIDSFLLKLRKEAACNVLYISGTNVFEARAIDARPLGYRTLNATPGWDHEIGVMMKRGSDSRAGKSFQKAGSLALPTDEVYAAIDAAKVLSEAAKAAERKAKAAWDAIPRIKHEDVADLIRAATEKVSE